MIFSIDFQHFLTHAIDYFTSDELGYSFEYMIISSKLKNGKRTESVVKPHLLYPTPEMIIEYNEYKDKEILKKLYYEYFDSKPDDNNWQDNVLYLNFIQPLLAHKNIIMISDQEEYDYIEAISAYLKEKFLIEVIDLNKLFSEGKIGPLYIDRTEIRNKAVDVRKNAQKIMQKNKESTADGRAEILRLMNKKEKIRKLKSLGIKVDGTEKNSELDQLLVDIWVNDDNDG